MRFAILIVSFFAALCCYASSKTSQLFGGHYILLNITWQSENQYPVIFECAVEADSVAIDNTDFDSFAQNILKSNPYIPSMGYAISEAYKIVFGNSRQTYRDWENFMLEYNEKYRELTDSQQIQLQDRSYIKIKYISLTGIFLYADKDSFYEKTVSSLGIDNPEWVSSIIVPISMVNYQKAENFKITIKR